MDSSREKQVQLDTLLPLICEQLDRGDHVKFFPRGVSMLPMLRQGRDAVILSPVTGKLRRFDLPFYRRENGQFVLHRIIRVGQTYTCMGDNQFEEESGVAHEQVIAVVTAFTRNGKLWQVTDPRYRLYCRLWYHSRHIRRFWRRGWGWLRRHLG